MFEIESYQDYIKLFHQKIEHYYNVTQLESRVVSTDWVLDNILDVSGSMCENTDPIEETSKKITFLNKKK